MDSRRVSSARIDSADGTGGRRPGEREEGCLPPPAYLLIHRLTFQCVFKRYDSFIRAIWYRCLESERGLAASLLVSYSSSSSFFMADRSLVPSRSGSVRNGTSGPLTWRKHRALSSSRCRIVYERVRVLAALFSQSSSSLGSPGAIEIAPKSEGISKNLRKK